MGRERWYVAVVAGGRLMERAAAEPDFGADLMVVGRFGPDRWRGRRPDDVATEVDAMNRLHPGIEHRIYTLDRQWDTLHYLLSPGRRRGEFAEPDPGTWAICGARSLPEHLRGGQGHPIRYSPPVDVAEVAAWLGELTAGDLRSAYAPAEMEDQCVYKFWSDRADDETWSRIVEYFEGLRAFYAACTAHGEGVLVIVT